MEKSQYELDLEALKRVDEVCELLSEEKRQAWAEVRSALMDTGRFTPNPYREFVQHLAKNRINLRFPG